jgi:hypothetical protein
LIFVLLSGVLLLLTACATTTGGHGGPAAQDPHAPSAPVARVSAGPPAFTFGADTFAFRNEIRARRPDAGDDLYAHYCFVLARGVRQFFQYARFDPEAPRLTSAEYEARVRDIATRVPWSPALAESDRVVIPGYAHLRAFSASEETAVKAGLGSPVGTWLHWTNWRVTLPVTMAHQAHIADEIVRELDHERLVQLLVTNWPIPELNHTVVVYRADDRVDHIDFAIWDPNEPERPGTMTFDRLAQRFWATDMYAVRPGPIRAFRMYHRPGL